MTLTEKAERVPVGQGQTIVGMLHYYLPDGTELISMRGTLSDRRTGITYRLPAL